MPNSASQGQPADSNYVEASLAAAVQYSYHCASGGAGDMPY